MSGARHVSDGMLHAAAEQWAFTTISRCLFNFVYCVICLLGWIGEFVTQLLVIPNV